MATIGETELKKTDNIGGGTIQIEDYQCHPRDLKMPIKEISDLNTMKKLVFEAWMKEKP